MGKLKSSLKVVILEEKEEYVDQYSYPLGWTKTLMKVKKLKDTVSGEEYVEMEAISQPISIEPK